MPAASDEARLLKLEEKVAYQDKLIAELNEVVVSLHKKHDQLEARFAVVEAALRSELGLRDVPNEKPPHY
jgi:SlyX protein